MSVFHIFYLANDKKDFEQLKKSIISITPIVSPEIANVKPQIYKNTESLFKIWCEYFSLRVENECQIIKHKSDHYGINFQYEFWFDAYITTQGWFDEIISFVGKIMKEYNGDCVLESNGDVPLIVRKDNAIIVDGGNLDDEQILLLKKLGLKYKKGDLKSL